MTIRKNHLFTNLILLILAIIITLFVAELASRLLVREELTGRYAEQHRLFCEYDKLLGWRHKPNTVNFHTQEEYSVKESFNSKGIRGPEYPYEKEDNEFRILVLGDSYAEGYTVEFEDLFSEVLKNDLIKKGINCRVINAGTSGYSTDQELLFFEKEGKKYKPDLTVVMFYENDVWYNNQPKYWRGYKPLFRLEKNDLILTNTPVPRPDSAKRNILPKHTTKSFFGNIKNWLIAHSNLYNFIMGRVSNIGWLYRAAIKLHLAEAPKVQPNATEKKNDDIILVPDSFRVWGRTYNAQIRSAWDVTEAIILKLKEETDSINSELLVFYIPNSASVYREEWEDTKKKYAISDKEWNVDQAGLELGKICKRNNIDFMNPTEQFRLEANKVERGGARLYIIKDGHWNVVGNNFTGQLLSDFVYSNYLRNKR